MDGHGQKLSQELKQQQKLILSPQMQQSLHLLQLPLQDLSLFLAEELSLNPLLELPEEEAYQEEDFTLVSTQVASPSSEDDKQLVIENSTPFEHSLFSILNEQAQESMLIGEIREALETLIGYLDSDGLLTTPLEEIADWENLSIANLEEALSVLQTFEPIGVGARSIQESMLLQLKHMGKETGLAYRIIDRYFEAMLQNKIPLIAKKEKKRSEEIHRVIEDEIARLDLRPGANLPEGNYGNYKTQLYPDVSVHFYEGKYEIDIHEGRSASLRFNKHYLNMLQEKDLNEETRAYLIERMSSGKNLMKNLFERNQTLYRLTDEIVKAHYPYFTEPKTQIFPLTMKEVADHLELHESTIARAVSGKNLAHPKGITPLRSFFTNSYTTESGEHISSQSVKEVLREIIAKEDRAKPLSDEVLSLKINELGVECARRTIAKYRQELGYGNASQRKRHSC
jgi:RNA polymerase sigma-54 factor